MKRIFLFLVVSAALFCNLPVPAAAGVPDSGDVVVLYDNDVHCTVAGYTVMAALKSDLLRETPNVILASSGDFLQGGNLGAATEGADIIRILNRVGYDFVTLGNHEFDYGMGRLAENSASFAGKILDCNLIDERVGKRMYDSYEIVDYGWTKVAFLGVSTPYSFASSSPSFFKDSEGNFIYSLSIDTIYDTIQNAVDDARNQGAEYVVVLSHLGDQLDVDAVNSHTMIAATSGIDVVLDGHAHNVIEHRALKNREGKDVILTSTGSHFANIGKLTISAADGSLKTELLPVAECGVRDASVDALVDSIQNEFDKVGTRHIGYSKASMPAKDAENVWIVRNCQQAVGDFCADALRYVTGSDIAYVGGGSIRSGLAAGEVTFSDIYAIFPFNNRICTVKVKGSRILDMLELAFSCVPADFGGYGHLSGITAVVDTAVESPVVIDENRMFVRCEGPRRVSDVRILNGRTGEYEPLDPDAEYLLAADNYRIIQMGDGFTMFNGLKANDPGIQDVSALEEYIVRGLEGIIPEKYGKAENRINIK